MELGGLGYLTIDRMSAGSPEKGCLFTATEVLTA